MNDVHNKGVLDAHDVQNLLTDLTREHIALAREVTQAVGVLDAVIREKQAKNSISWVDSIKANLGRIVTCFSILAIVVGAWTVNNIKINIGGWSIIRPIPCE